MGRNAGYIALWCGIANGAEDILLPERYDGNEQYLINGSLRTKSAAKASHHHQRWKESDTPLPWQEGSGGDRYRDPCHPSLATSSEAVHRPVRTVFTRPSWVRGAAELLAEGKSNRIVAYKDGKFVDFDIQEALNMKRHPGGAVRK